MAAFDVSRARSDERRREAAAAAAEADVVAIVEKEVEARVKNSCLLAAPTGCASFQLKFGASTLHRCFGVPVGFCGAWKNRAEGRFRKIKLRMEQARLFVIDEMSMVGRQMLGKIEFKVRDTLKQDVARLPEGTTLCGRDTVLSGDLKQANPIGDDPLYRMGDYNGKGQNKPRGAERTPDDAWSTHRLVRMGMEVRDAFEDVCVCVCAEASAPLCRSERRDSARPAREVQERRDAIPAGY